MTLLLVNLGSPNRVFARTRIVEAGVLGVDARVHYGHLHAIAGAGGATALFHASTR